ncbi:MAG TPA: redoxin domain-containing protein [Tahibacter sp.]|nr:redoxin domain-containing protein [Tahibacter sp.]
MRDADDSEAWPLLPEWQVSTWFNTPTPLRVADLRGRVVLLHAFQMLCPGCVMQALPQAARVHETLAKAGVAVIGLHTVFEHHDAMQPSALAAFIHEYRLRFPIGVDAPAAQGPIPQTMQRLGLRGTPSCLLLDRRGRLRLQHFGALDDLALGAALGRLLSESDSELTATPREPSDDAGCTPDACPR